MSKPPVVVVVGPGTSRLMSVFNELLGVWELVCPTCAARLQVPSSGVVSKGMLHEPDCSLLAELERGTKGALQ